MNLLRLEPSSPAPLSREIVSGGRVVLSEEAFERMIALERKRTERSQNPFLLMLLQTGDSRASETAKQILTKILSLLMDSTRETDSLGWYKEHTVIGVVFTELVIEDKNSTLCTMLGRISGILQNRLSFDEFSQISISFHFFPDKWDADLSQPPRNRTLYPDLSKGDNAGRVYSGIKRIMDVSGALLMLLVFCPVFLLISLAIKLSSKGPVFFRQTRVGQHGKTFTFLKFRSMYVNNDPGIHIRYVKQLIAGQAQRNLSAGSSDAPMYKLTSDPRVTGIGALLRRTSLDELPQLLSVLSGDMSLVGPRPALAYEVAVYQTWHRRRVLEVKPGITGLWQVSGRCRLKFDEAVRLDIRYAKNWTPWLDVKILLRTPRAVWQGEGAC